MLTGPELGAAIEAARQKKGITKKALADAFGVSPPSIQDWVKRGTIDKQKLAGLWHYFRDVVGPEHWGLTAWEDEQPPSAGLQAHTVAQVLIHPPLQSANFASKRVPVIGTLAMGAEQMFELKAEPGGRTIGTVHAQFATAGSHALQVFGDDLYPAVRHGTCLVVSPGSPCAPAELMLLETSEGYYLVCELVAEHADAVIWTPAAGGQRRTMPRDLIGAMHPIVGMVPGSQMQTTRADQDT